MIVFWQLLAQLSKPVTVDESEIKRKIMDNYGFVDTEHDRKYHRPQLVSKKGVSYERKELIFFTNISFYSKKRRK